MRLLGKKGAAHRAAQGLGQLARGRAAGGGPAHQRCQGGIQAAIEARRAALDAEALRAELARGAIDVTLPGRGQERGSMHPVTRTRLRIERIFMQAGFEVATGPEVEDDFHNFEALNIPPNHPARAMHDTFYFPDGRLLRTHTSPVQIRAMRAQKPPMSVIAPGRVYRSDSDMTHTPMFHQVEGIAVGRERELRQSEGDAAHLRRAVLRAAARACDCGPSYFPFTEPSAEVDIECVFCHGAGCRVCKQTGWLEMLGLRNDSPQRARGGRHR